MTTDFPGPFGDAIRAALDFIDTKILERSSGAALELPRITLRQRWTEWLIILLAVTVYCLPFLNLNTLDRLRGNESEVFQSLDQLLSIGAGHSRQIPLWNPYIDAGVPYIADPMLHVYNPFISIPVLLFGALNGFKIAVYLAFLLAAFGMWWLARLLGLGPTGRLWMSLLYAFAGATMARFFQGQYLLTLAAGWIPWAIAGVYASITLRRRRFVVVAATSLALLFMCGNAYYAYYILYALAILVLVMGIQVMAKPLRLRANVAILKILLTIGVLAFGLIAIQFLPLAEFWSRISKATNLSLSDSQNVQQVFLDLTSNDPRRADAISALPPEEFYAYIGWWPFLALTLLPFAWKRNKSRIIAYFILLFAFTLPWIDIRDMPGKGLYLEVPLFYQFRYPTRMLIFGTVSLVALSGIALDAAMMKFDSYAHSANAKIIRLVCAIVKYALIVFLIISIGDVAVANRRHLATQKYYAPPDQVLGWLKQHDSTPYYISAPNGWHHAAVANELRYLDAWYHFNDIRRYDGMLNKRNVQAGAKYKIISSAAPAPDNSVLVQKLGNFSIYELLDSLPFAFSVQTSDLTTPSPDGTSLPRAGVLPLEAYTSTLSEIEFIAQGAPDRTLVVLSALVPGWHLAVDDREVPISNVSGYMAATLVPGTHRYVFSYHPGSFDSGRIITLIFLILALALGLSDWEPSWRPSIQRVRAVDWRGLGDRVRDWKPGLASIVARRGGIQTMGATYADELIKLDQPIALEDGARVNVTIASKEASVWDWWTQSTARLLDAWLGKITWQGVLFTIGLGIYLFAALYRISDFPIYFFGDEAIQTTSAAHLVDNGFRGPNKELLPTYFVNGSYYNLGTSVYLQVIPYLLFGKSVEVTRAVSALLSFLAALALGLTLRNIFKSPYWWSAPLILGIAPAWFLHSRTAFETVVFASTYAIFLYLYMQYRLGSPSYLYSALIVGALAFYSYSPGQVIFGVTALALVIFDFRYHWQNRVQLLRGLGLAIVLLLPYLRFRFTHTFSPEEHLRILGSYWVDPLPLSQKVLRFFQDYLYGLSPQYWFIPNNHDLVRHVMKGYGHLWIGTLPFFAVGTALAVKRARESSYRVLLIALLASPAGAALADIGIARALAFIIPATLLTVLGLNWVLEWFNGWLRKRNNSWAGLFKPAVSVVLFLALAAFRVSMMNDALTNGPTWFPNYGLYGMQYGARQVFQDTIRPALSKTDAHYFVSPIWANGADNLTQFFLTGDEQKRVQLLGIGSYIAQRMSFSPVDVFVLTPDDYKYVSGSGIFKEIAVQQILKYPDGTPGFYFVHLAYVDNINQIFAQEEEERLQPSHAEVVVQNRPATITYSKIEAGQPKDMFDGKFDTLVRGIEANPFVVDLVFQQPFKMTGLSADFGHMKLTLKVDLYVDGRAAALHFETSSLSTSGDPHVDLNFSGGPYDVTRIHIEILDLDVSSGSPAKIHVRELKLNP